MSRTALFVGAVLVIALGSSAFRLPDLGNRIVHADESVHAVKLWELRSTGRYRYDPDEFHGPTLYYAALPALSAQGRSDFGALTESDCRLPVALAGVGMILLVALLAPAIGRRAALLTMLLLGLSPAFVFYSRYYIQETFLVAFTAGALGCFVQWARSPRLGWAMLGGAFAGLMLASKETAILSLGAWGAAVLLFRSPSGPTPRRVLRIHAGLAMAACCLTAAALLTGFGSNVQAVVDYVRSYGHWLVRAHGSDLHRQPWSYYCTLIGWRPSTRGPVWTEGAILLLGCIGGIVSLRRPREARGLFGRRLLVFTAIQLAAYSVTPYKTPWCVLNPLLGVALLGGLGGDALLTMPRRLGIRYAAGLLMVVGWIHLGWLAQRTSFVYQNDPRNPYLHSPTVPDALEFRRRAMALAAFHPDRMRMVIKVFWNDAYYWPIPWYLRGFDNVGYWQGVPADADAPLIFASPEYDEELTRRLDATHLMNGYIGLRRGTVAMVWVRMDLWTRYVESRRRASPADGL